MKSPRVISARRVLVLAVLLMAWVVFRGGPKTTEVRLDSGDLRFCFLGIPFRHQLVYYRSAIQYVTARQPAIKAKWYLVGDWHDHEVGRYYDVYAPAWLSIDPSVARIVYVDLARVARVGWPRHSHPPCGVMLWWIGDGALTYGEEFDCVKPGWRRSPGVIEYLREHGHTLGADLPPPPADGPGSDSAGYALLLAARRGDSSEVAALLQAGADPKATAGFGWSALHEAASLGRKAAVEALLEAGADPSSRDGLNWTPLHWAAAQGDEVVVGLLCARGAEVDAGNTQGYTPLHLAADRGHAGAVRALVAAHADVNATAGDGYTPLILAAASGEADVVVALLDAGADPARKDNDKWGAWDWLIFYGDTELARLFLSQQDTRKPLGQHELGFGLRAAAGQGNGALVDLLLANGGDPNWWEGHDERTALHAAARRGDLEVVRLLLAAGANVSAKDREGRTPLSVAIVCCHKEVANLLREHGATQ
jgi:ankyrin repeat protein